MNDNNYKKFIASVEFVDQMVQLGWKVEYDIIDADQSMHSDGIYYWYQFQVIAPGGDGNNPVYNDDTDLCATLEDVYIQASELIQSYLPDKSFKTILKELEG